MYKYAELKYGKVVAIIEHLAALTEFKTFFSPTSYFIDVTGQEVEVGNVVTFNPEVGLTFTDATQEVLNLEETKILKIARLKAKRDKLEIEVIEVDGFLFDYDSKAEKRLNVAHSLLEIYPTKTITWSLSDNTQTEITLDICKHIIIAVATRSTLLHEKYNALKVEANACTTKEEVDSIVWE